MEQLYFSIAQVSKITKISEPLLRKWEGEFVQLSPKRGARGVRRYTQKEIDLINTIKRLRDEHHLDYEGIRQKLISNHDEEEIKTLVRNRLLSVRTELVAIRRQLNSAQAFDNETIVDGGESGE